MPGADNPRIQTIEWEAGQEVVLTAFPQSGLTVMLEPGEQIRRVTLENSAVLEVKVSPELDSLLILPQLDETISGIMVATDRRDYRFTVQTGTGLSAAYLVQFQYGAADPPRTRL